MKTNREYLLDILTYIEYQESFIGEGRSMLEADMKTQLAVRKAYEVIGEIVKRLPQSLLDQQPQIRWKEIKGFRDVLSHLYDEIDLNIVWRAAEDLPNLRIAVQAMLNSLDTEDNSNFDAT